MNIMFLDLFLDKNIKTEVVMLERVSDFIFTKKKSYRFIFFSILFLNQFLLLSTVQAKIFNINKSADFQLRKEVIKEIILDYENYCEQGCKYKLTGIKEMKILEILDANHIFTWTYVDNIKKYKYFWFIYFTPTFLFLICRWKYCCYS